MRTALEGATPQPMSNADVRRVVVGGGVRVDGRVVRAAGRPLRTGARVAVHVDLRRLASQGGGRAAPGEPRVLFEDADVLAVDKPAGLPTVPTADARRTSLAGQVAAWLTGRAHGTPRAPGVHQRLDATTSGVVVFSKTRAAAAGLDAAFSGHHVEKVYLALCTTSAGDAPQRIDEALDVSGRGKRGRVTPSPEGRPATTWIRVREQLGAYALVEARPATGRKHQVRAHLASGGLPILGDVRYGGPAHVRGRAITRPMLHASRLCLPHPVSGVPLSFSAPLPEDFEDLLAWLRLGDAPARRAAGVAPTADRNADSR